MKKVEIWPPPNHWIEVIIMWDEILGHPYIPIGKLLDWVNNAPGGEYHLSGYKSIEGFSFRFRRGVDATIFRLYWS
jgi:hypothetical protein